MFDLMYKLSRSAPLLLQQWMCYHERPRMLVTVASSGKIRLLAQKMHYDIILTLLQSGVCTVVFVQSGVVKKMASVELQLQP